MSLTATILWWFTTPNSPCITNSIIKTKVFSHIKVRFFYGPDNFNFLFFPISGLPQLLKLFVCFWKFPCQCFKVRRKGAGSVAQQAKLRPPPPASHMGAASSPSCTTSDPVPCLWAGKATEDAPSLAPSTHVGDLDKVLGSVLWIPSALVIMPIWRVNQQMENLSFAHSLFLFCFFLNSTFQIK